MPEITATADYTMGAIIINYNNSETKILVSGKLSRFLSCKDKAGFVELLSEYGLFLAKIVTIVLAIAAIAAIVINTVLSHKPQRGQLRVCRLNEQYKEMKDEVTAALMEPAQQKLWQKAQKKKRKQQTKQAKMLAKQQTEPAAEQRNTVYVLDFKGSMSAQEVSSLREEITALLAVVKTGDQVLLRLESLGGVVHGYGLAASQLQRLRERNIPLTVAVDKVAASGGYMMACVANEIVAAPFAILGSIGVVAQIPNFHRLLKNKDIDIELHTAGQYKRTLTMLGENTREGREKFRADLDQVHDLFKDFVKNHRPDLDINLVATGEYWYGTQAQQRKLVDRISTSDDLILDFMQQYDVVSIKYIRGKKLLEKLTGSATENLDQLLLRWWQRSERPLL